MRMLAVGAIMAVTVGAVVASPAEAQGKSGRQVVAESVAQDIRPVERGAVIHGVSIGAPGNRETYVTDTAMIAVLEQGQATAEFSLPGRGTVQPDGSVRVVTSKGVMVEIAVPWAKDANGRSLPTFYTVTGNRLVQTVDTKGATFPVAADPTIINCGLFTPCLKFTRSETLSISDAMVVGVAAGTAALCGRIPWSPVYLGALKVACAGYVAANWSTIRSNALTAKSTGRCLALRFTTTGLPLGSRVVTC